jgi:tRNA threonylcarbamoyladenosine biosynthesis protein TsaE
MSRDMGLFQNNSVYQKDLKDIAAKIKSLVKTPAIIVLSGPVGAGKTTFAKSFVTEQNVQSPTYSIVNESGNIVHADFYRIKNVNELVHLELPLYLEDKDYFLIEWGKSYVNELVRLLDLDFSLYELEININENDKNKDEIFSRTFTLNSI